MHKKFDEVDLLSNNFNTIENLAIGSNYQIDLHMESHKDLPSTTAPCIDDEEYTYSEESIGLMQ